MPCFVCSKCECIENTALSNYWVHGKVAMFKWPPELEPFKGQPLCSECGPTEYSNGEKTDNGTWHGEFPKEHWSKHYETRPAIGLLY